MQESSLFFFFKSTNKKQKSRSDRRLKKKQSNGQKRTKSKSSPNIFQVADSQSNLLQQQLSIKTDLKEFNIVTNSRTVFLDLQSLHKCWLNIPSNILCNSIIILPNIYIEWILNPSKCNNIPPNISAILSDNKFSSVLQFKHQQGLLFCMLNSAKTISKWNLPVSNNTKLIIPFWQYFSNILSGLNDPFITHKTTNYNPLIFNFNYYENKALYQSKYQITSAEIISELTGSKTQIQKQLQCEVISEILYQSNPSFNIVFSCSDIIKTIINPQQLKTNDLETSELPIYSMSPVSPVSPCDDNELKEQDIDILLDAIVNSMSKNEEITMVNDNNYNDKHFTADEEWWFAPAYQSYDGFQEVAFSQQLDDVIEGFL